MFPTRVGMNRVVLRLVVIVINLQLKLRRVDALHNHVIEIVIEKTKGKLR